MSILRKIIAVLILLSSHARGVDDRFRERDKRWISYTYNSAIGMFTAFAVPVDLPEREILFSWNIEANYNLPTNLSIYDLTPPERSFMGINRTSAYSLIEQRLDNFGYNGHQCLLRIICDVAKTPISHNGLIGHVLHILFTPSTSLDEGLSEESSAESHGYREDSDCARTFKKCPKSVLDMISQVSY